MQFIAIPRRPKTDGLRAGDLEAEFAEMDWLHKLTLVQANFLLGVGNCNRTTLGLMSEVAQVWNYEYCLTRRCFQTPEIYFSMSLQQTLDINTIRWLERISSTVIATMIIISHEPSFLIRFVVLTMAGLDYGEFVYSLVIIDE